MCVAWSLAQNGKSRSEERKANMGKREAQTRWRSKVERHTSIRKMEGTRKPFTNVRKVGDPNESSNVLQDGNKEAVENRKRDHRIQQDKACLHLRYSWMREKAFGIYSTKRSWRSHRKEREQFNKSKKSQVHSDAPSDGISGCNSSSGQNNWRSSKRFHASMTIKLRKDE